MLFDVQQPTSAIAARTTTARARAIGLTLAVLALALPAAAQTPLSCGQIVTGTIAAPGEQDEFSFFGEQNDVVTFTLVGVELDFLILGQVFRPGGASLRTIGPATQNVTRLPDTGTYTVRLYDNLGHRVGNYAVRIGWVLPAAKQCGDRATLGCGQTASGTIATPMEADLFIFSGQQGETVTLTLSQTGFGQGLPFAQRVSPSGDLLGTIITSFPAVMTLPETGTYAVVVHDNINTGLSAYTLGLTSSGPCAGPTPPGSPSNLSASVAGSTVTLHWTPPGSGGPVSAYVVEAGVAPGDVSVGIFDTGSAATTLSAAAVPPGTYYVRVKGRNVSGAGPASNEVVATVGSGPSACTTAPTSPTGLTGAVNGQTVTLSWTAAGGIVSTYVIQAGSVSGASNLVNAATGGIATSLAAVAPAGTYFVRVAAQNACGISPASNEVVVTVP